MNKVSETLGFLAQLSDALETPMFAKVSEIASIRLAEYLIRKTDMRGTLIYEGDLEVAATAVNQATQRMLEIHFGGIDTISAPTFAIADDDYIVALYGHPTEIIQIMALLGLAYTTQRIECKAHIRHSGYEVNLHLQCENPSQLLWMIVKQYNMKDEPWLWSYPENLNTGAYRAMILGPTGKATVISIRKIPEPVAA